MENFRIKTSVAKEEAYVDVAFWGGIVPGNEVPIICTYMGKDFRDL